MKKLLSISLVVTMCFLLLAGCSSKENRTTDGTGTIDGIPASAVEVYSTSQEDLSVGEYSPGQWEADEKGYFLIDYDYVSGDINSVRIRRNDNFIQDIYTIPEPATSGIYATDTIDFSKQNCEYALYLAGAENYSASFAIYFVPSN